MPWLPTLLNVALLKKKKKKMFSPIVIEYGFMDFNDRYVTYCVPIKYI